MNIVCINTCNNGSTGKIMLGIADMARKEGHNVACCYLKNKGMKTASHPDDKLISNFYEYAIHYELNLFTGLNGCFSIGGTRRFVKWLEQFKPDVIHLHNLHNCYINLPMLFNYIKKNNVSVVWTLHDTWAFTGKCPYFTMAKCEKWRTGCSHCPQYKQYPPSYVDHTKTMWKLKKKWFCGVKNMTIVTPSQWLAELVKESFLGEYPIKVINNGIDLSIFKPTANDFRTVYNLQNKKIVLSVAFGWGERKGYGDCLKLAEILDDDYHLVLVGVSKEQIANLPKNILGIERTNSQKELATIYSASDVFINTTYEDNYPTVNLEARACGLPVITYNTGGSPESAGADAVIVEVGDIQALKEAIEVTLQTKKHQTEDSEISSEAKFAKYIELYNSANAGGGILP